MLTSKWKHQEFDGIIIWFNSKTFDNLQKFISLCGTGTPMEIIQHIREFEYDRYFMTSTILIRMGTQPHSPIYAPPFLKPACHHHNLRNIIALLELGVNPEAKCQLKNKQLISIRKMYSSVPEFSELFAVGKFWWRSKYSDTQKVALKDEFESAIRDKDYCSVIWHLIRGMRLDSPEILAEDSFNDFPSIMKDMVCRIGIPNEKIESFLNWLREHTSCQDTLASMESAASRKADIMDTALENLRLSMDLMKTEDSFDMIQSVLLPEEQILMLQWLADHYDMTVDKNKAYDIFMSLIWWLLDSITPPK